jgi:hypothetical protein
MTQMPELSQGQLWVESDGEVLPAQTGPNAPSYPGVNTERNRQELEDMHGDIAASRDETTAGLETPVDPTAIINNIRSQVGKPPARPIFGNPLEGATAKYYKGREAQGRKR